MRLVKHSNPDAMPTMWPPDDQGRSVEYGEDGAPRGGAIGGLLACVAILAIIIGAGLLVGKIIEWCAS